MKRVTLDVDQLIRDYLAGESEKSISDRLRVGRPTIRRRLLERGIEPRDRSSAMFQRMANSSPEERARLTDAAHAAVRGRVQTEVHRERIAATNAARKNLASDLEGRFASLLIARGQVFGWQMQVGRYVCDFTLGPVAVEIYGGHWHFSGAHLARAEHRFRYLADRGWHVLAIAVTGDWPLGPAAAEYAISYAKESQGDPAAVREYRVIGGGGQFFSTQRADADHLSFKYPRASSGDAAARRHDGITG